MRVRFSLSAWINKNVKTAINTSQRRETQGNVLLSEKRAGKDVMKVISHDLHTPLHVIIGLCQLLERDRNATLSPMQLDAVERIERNGRSLLETVNHLLGRLRSGHLE